MALVLALALALPMTTLVGANPDPGIVGLWHFDEATGTTASDSSGNNNHGTIYGAGWVGGKFGQALSFDGSDDEIIVTADESLNMTSAFTLVAWVKPNGADEDGYIICKGRATDYGMYWYGSRDTLMFFPGGLAAESNDVFIDDNVWVHTAITVAAGVLTFYRNGVAVGTASVTPADNNKNVFIGNRVGPTTSVHTYFNGIIDEVRIYNRALSAEEIAVLANPISVIEVPVDIKPTSCPNPLNVKSKGVLPVAILGTEDFDVTEIDVSTVLLEGVSPLRWSLEDVATPYGDTPEDCLDCTEEGPDGYMDITLKFDTQEIVTALDEVNDGDCLVLTLTGELNDGTAISGVDVVRILKKGKK